MQKKSDNYPFRVQLLFPLSRLKRVNALTCSSRSVLSISLCLLFLGLVSCAHYEDQRIDLNRLDTATEQVDEATPLMRAAEKGDSGLLKRALEQGGKINAVSERGTAFSLALENGHEAISRILLSAGSDWQLGFDGQKTNALVLAADLGFDEIVKMLILRGAPLEAKDKNGHTALSICAKNGHLTTLKILINAGANVNVEPQGRSVLMHVVEKNNMLISQLLIAAGADLNYSDAEGDTALKIARRNGYFDLDLMLVQAGARP